jgi:hypothetical protein
MCLVSLKPLVTEPGGFPPPADSARRAALMTRLLTALKTAMILRPGWLPSRARNGLEIRKVAFMKWMLLGFGELGRPGR